MEQLALPLAWDRGPDSFAVTASSERAVRMLDGWRDWPVPVAILAGPPRSGRSLLARIFAGRSGAAVLDDADRLPEADLFHAWNRARDGEHPLLLVSRALPPEWRVDLPDLRSRLGASVAVELEPPDDLLARTLLHRGFERHGLDARADLLDWLVARSERTHAGLEDVADLLARAAAEQRRRLSIPFARLVLTGMEAAPDPGDEEDA